MASTTETGHAKNLSTFEQLISYCTSYGSAYNPGKANLKLAALNTQYTTATTALQAVKIAKANYDNATNNREVAFKKLRPLATKIINALSACGATKETIADAKTSNRKIQSQRPKAKEKHHSTTVNTETPYTKTISTSQQSYTNLLNHFTQLVATLSAEPNYSPNETELTLTTLSTLVTNLTEKNTAVISATTTLSNARIARNKILYHQTTGILATAQQVKQYVKSIFGYTSSQYKQLTALKFKPQMPA
jgi:hypothetical protein